MRPDYWTTEDGKEEREAAGVKVSGYSPCVCRDCFELTAGGGYCADCVGAGCQDRHTGECLVDPQDD